MSFKSKRLERFFFSGYTKALKFANKNRVVDVLERLERSENLRQLSRPKDRLHKLKGGYEGFYSIRISKNYRIIFRWVEEEGAHDVDLLDYHQEGWVMRMFNPPHPGRQVREDIEVLGWTVTEAAVYLGCSRKQLSDIVNLKAGISPEMAIRLSAIIGGSPGLWCRMQLDYDLWQVEGRTDKILGTVKQPPKEKYMIHDEEGGYFDPPDLKLMLKNASGPIKSRMSVG